MRQGEEGGHVCEVLDVPGSLQDKSDADLERMKSTVMLCYGYVSYHSPPQ